MLVTEPHREASKTMVLTGICRKCAKCTDTQLVERAFKDLKEMGIAKQYLGPLGPTGHA